MTGFAPERVLVRAPNWLGDVAMALPALASIRRHFAGSRLALALPEGLAALGARLPGVDHVVGLRTGGGLAAFRENTSRLRAGGHQVAVLLTNSFGSALAIRRAGIPERWGYRADGRRWLLSRAVPRRVPRGLASRHHAFYYLRLVEALGIEPLPAEARVAVDEPTRALGRALLERAGVDATRPLVGLAPGAAYGHAKRWPPDRVAHLIRRLLHDTGAACVLVGAPADRDAGHAIESRLGLPHGGPAGDERVANLIARTDIAELMGVMGACRAFVSNDSGAMHLAAAIGVHVTAVFGPTDERATAPLGPHTVVTHPVRCRPCLLRECPIDHRCMTRITPDDVFDSVARPLGEPGGSAGAPG